MQNRQRIALFTWTLGILFLVVMLAACGSTLDDIGERPDPSQSPAVQRTATPGGVVSVWMLSPTGQAISNNGTPVDGTPRGEIVGPAATATALTGTLTAATQTAAAPANVPNFQSNECPEPTGRVPEPRPATFNEFPSAIGTYLSDGGPTTVLEGELQLWGGITSQGGYVQADTDLTRDGNNEVIITLFNPFDYNPTSTRNAGQLLIYGCDGGNYRLLYASPYSPELEIPVLHRVGDMNNDIRPEVVFEVKACNYYYCTQEAQILTWNPITGSFITLNNSPIIGISGRIGVEDIDFDGVLELRVVSNTTDDEGERRRIVDFWDWTGLNYVLADRD